MIPGLYTRGRLSPAWDRERRRCELEGAGINVVVSLTRAGEPDIDGSRFRYLHRPMPDGATFDRSIVLELAAVLAGMIRTGDRVLVMCRAGRNRAGLVAAATVRAVTGLSGAESLELVRHVRPRAVANPDFEGWLESLPGRPGEEDWSCS